jgi:hypothetical protein
MSDYFGGLDCGSNPGGNTCLLKPNANPTVPYSFVNLPANVIFSASGNANVTGYERDASTSTSGILATLVNNTGGTVVPEPTSLLLVGGGVLALLRWRARYRA